MVTAPSYFNLSKCVRMTLFALPRFAAGPNFLLRSESTPNALSMNIVLRAKMKWKKAKLEGEI